MEDQVGVGWDLSNGALSISEMGGDVKRTLTAFFHAHHALIPAFDHFSDAEDDGERASAVDGGVEFLTVVEEAFLIYFDQSAFNGFATGAELSVCDLEFCRHFCHYISI